MHKRKKHSFESLEQRQLLAADPIITEFMASNGSTLDDGNGTSSDWIEIYNNGDQSVDLAGYGLSDDATNLNKWLFPSHVLEPGDFLVVFASGNNATDSAGNLHTNFSLSAGGEYLAFVDPSETVLTEFGPGGTDYPAQTSDVSYGLAFDATGNEAVTPDSSAQYLIPSDDTVDGIWTANGFDDSSWQTGTASIGFENSPADYASLIQTAVPTGTTSVYVRIPFTVTDADTQLSALEMKYDDGFIAYLNGQVIEDANAPAVGEFDSLATGEHPDGLAVNYVSFDVSAHSDKLVVGENTLAIHMLNRSAGSSDLLSVPHLLLSNGGLIEPYTIGPLDSPTPRLPNSNLRASDVVFSRTGGAFVGSFQLSMTSSDVSESIRYTTDGSLPTASSQLYTGPITVSSSTEFRARSFGPVGQLGGVTTEAYSLTDTPTSNFTSDLPIVVLENFSQGTPGTGDFEDANLALYEVDSQTGRSALAKPADVTTIIGQHRRGSSTSGNPKTNLRIELRNENGEDKSIPLLDMPSESDWILYAPYNFDRAMLRNTTYFDLSRQMGNYAARTRFVEVYANYNNGVLDENDYLGVYVLMENIKRDSNRVDVEELTSTQNTEPDITGGYILKLDRSDGSFDSSWFTERNIPTLSDSRLVHVEPERADMTIAQRDYIRGYVQDFEDALFGPNSTDPELGYQAYLDVDATIDHHLLRVLSKEPDGLRLSTFLTKDRDGKLAFGPVWDFDRSSGADNDGRSANPEGWFLPDVDFFESDWWGPLFDDPNFMQRWVDRWQELRLTSFSDANIQATIGGQAAEIAEGQVRNFDRWPNIAPNGGTYAAPGLTGWEAEVSHLTNWLITRANWIDDQLVSAPMFSPSPGNIPGGSQIVLSAEPASAEIYYTLDGSDPRADGGGLSPSATLYTGPITANQTVQLNARTLGTPIASETSNSSSPGNEGPENAIDGITGSKYLNFGKENSGIIITPNFGSSTVRSFQLTTANDAEARDPSSWELYGTNESIQSLNHSTGLAENWTLISSGDVTLPSARDTIGPLVSFGNSTAYTSYKLMFPTVKNAGSTDSMQVAEIAFFQSSNGTGTQVLSGGGSVRAVHVATGAAVDGLSPWSKLVSGLFSVEVPADASSLRITEVHYHPANPTPEELLIVPGADEDDFEFIELYNASNDSISLNGVTLSQAVTFDFTAASITSLAPGETVLVVKDEDAFVARYGSSLPVAGEYSGKLSDGGEQVVLMDGASQVIHDFTYDDAAPWPLTADGDGPSMQITDPMSDHDVGSNWVASTVNGGTPGEFATASQGDFDQDGDVDGSDFLAWQRGLGTVYDANHLAEWQQNYGQPLQAIAAAAFAPQQFASVYDSSENVAPSKSVEVTLEPSEHAAINSALLSSANSYAVKLPVASSDIQMPGKRLSSDVDTVFTQWEGDTSYQSNNQVETELGDAEGDQSVQREIGRARRLSLRSMLIEEQVPELARRLGKGLKG